MTKWIIGALLLVATISFADKFGESPFKQELQLRADGVIDYNTLVISSVVNTTTLARVSGCPKTIVKKFNNGGTIDTIVFTSCPQTNAFWIGSGMDTLDGSGSLSDVVTLEKNGDTLFVKRQSAAGCLGAYVWMRVY